jgi:hypothetical protein
MRLLAVLAITIILLAAAPAGVAAQEPPLDPAFRADILRLMDVMGTGNMTKQMPSMLFRQLMEDARKEHVDLSGRAYEIQREVLEQEVTKALDGPEGLVAKMVPIYARHFSREDVRGLIAFYESDLGRRMVAEMPALAQETIRVGMQWGKDLAPHVEAVVRERLKAEGLVKE